MVSFVMKHPLLLSAALLASCSAAPAPAPAQGPALAPTEIVAASPASDWAPIAASDLLVMDLAPDAKGAARRVVIQLLPAPFSQGWIGNIRKLAAAKWWDGTSVNRVQDGYVVQWGDPDAEDKAKMAEKARKDAEKDLVKRESQREKAESDAKKGVADRK